jgi:hypothetical protein
MPEYVVTLLTAYIVDAPNERDAGEAAYDVATGATGRIRNLGSPRDRGQDVHFTDGRTLKAFNAELAVPVEEVVERSEAEMMQAATELMNDMLGEDVPDYEVWTVKQKNMLWWVHDHEGVPIISDDARDTAIELATAIGKDADRVFKIVQEKS